ncbi:MAG TPA: hypothetical protein VFS21_26945 [Roseiflexaceae bacterium]|nr:hypothetical protein [Roseiflexaceae bacterium]
MEHKHTKGLYGWITHTEFVSSDPEASKRWCAKVLGWDFRPSFPTPDGDYYLFSYSEQGGGGIRQGKPPAESGSIPFVHVENTQVVFDTAIREGAEEVIPPTNVMEGVTTALVRAPGGLLIGFSGP